MRTEPHQEKTFGRGTPRFASADIRVPFRHPDGECAGYGLMGVVEEACFGSGRTRRSAPTKPHESKYTRRGGPACPPEPPERTRVACRGRIYAAMSGGEERQGRFFVDIYVRPTPPRPADSSFRHAAQAPLFRSGQARRPSKGGVDCSATLQRDSRSILIHRG